MAKLIDERLPMEKVYTLELTQSEVNALASVIGDLAHSVLNAMVYLPARSGLDDSLNVSPTRKFKETMASLAEIISDSVEDYDIDDWTSVEAVS